MNEFILVAWTIVGVYFLMTKIDKIDYFAVWFMLLIMLFLNCF